jgi:tetratricopeptide (TPR) repeat protein
LLKEVVLALVADGTLERTAGRWHFRETEPIDAMAFESLRGPLAETWGSFEEAERMALLAIAITRSLIPEHVLVSTFGTGVLRALGQAAQRGWAANNGGNWELSAELVRTHLLAEAAGGQQIAAATALLTRSREHLSRECLADVLLLAGEPGEAYAIGLEAAHSASEQGQHSVAEGRLRAILSLGRGTLEQAATAEVLIDLASALNAQGKHFDAVHVLSASTPWENLGPPSPHLANRAHLLGQLYMTLGDVPSARNWLEESSREALAVGALSTWLRAQADLAQIDWELGSERERTDAIARIKRVLTETEGMSGIGDERASLWYGLGAALILSGDREAGKAGLLVAMQTECSDYWKMRMANALVSATTLLGEYQESLVWTEEAWRRAENAGTDSFKARILSNRGALFHSVGRYRESVEQDLLAVEWAQKTGNTFEYESGLIGATINNIILARYEEALSQAKEGRLLARHSGNELNAAKTAELEALALYYVGDLSAALNAVNEGSRILEDHEYVETRPRLDWLLGKIMAERGERREAIELLAKAEKGLLQSTDLQDLMGIQVDLKYIQSDGEDWRGALAAIGRLVETAEQSGVLLARVSGAVAVGEIIAEYCPEVYGYDGLLQGALAQADSSGVLEASWQLDGSLGLIALARGEQKASHASINRAVRTIREISERLVPERRRLYLRSRRVQRRLAVFTSAM